MLTRYTCVHETFSLESCSVVESRVEGPGSFSVEINYFLDKFRVGFGIPPNLRRNCFIYNFPRVDLFFFFLSFIFQSISS